MADDAITQPANPAPLGLVGFGMTTVLLSLVNAHALPGGGESVVIPLALTYGGLIQLIAGVMEFRTGNTFGMVAFLSYGAFWWWFAILLMLSGNGIIDVSQAGPTIGVALILWGVFTFYMWIATFRLNRALWLVFLTLWITYFLLGIGDAIGFAAISTLGGYIGILCGGLAMYTSFGEVTNATFGRVVIPLGAPG
ncbi:acetate uptake transporter [Salinisphaera sp.]|uniref:acetate uptake transporter n=1 Tax=Salinisphaera sp. TaxID=1914330 RepID=UPI002D7850D7|nr:acetate uptake transporter [Salinisphaera sp.]HET7314596.1 acetate uptake transporter [Salinisphaera sp.]